MHNKLSRRLEVGKLTTNIDGQVFRVISKISTLDGSTTFKLSNLCSQPCSVPVDFRPISPALAKFASWLKYVLAYNKDLTKMVNSIIEQHGYPTDPKMDWSAYVQEAMAPALAAVSPDFDLQDEAIYQVTVVRALLDRDILADFPTAIKKFPKGVQNLPIERQVSEYLKKAFVWRIQEAKKYMQTVQPAEEMSMEQPAHDTEGGEAYSLLDTEEHATGVQDYTEADAERDFKAFREEFYKWSVKKNKASAYGFALLLTIYWEQVQQAEGELKFGDLTQEWLRRSHLGFDSLKTYDARLPQVLKDFVQSNVGVMKGKYELMDLIGFLLPKKKEKAQPAKASSKSAAGVEGDLAQAKSETDSTGAIDPDIKAALGISVPMEKFAAKPTCPHCGSDDYGLMPTDFETAKCNNCGKNWEHGIVKGINDPKTAFFSPEDAKRFRDENQGSNVALNQHEEDYQKWEPVFPEKDKEAAANLGQCSCEWEACPLGHPAAGCPNPAAHLVRVLGEKTRLCKECIDATRDFLAVEHGDVSLGPIELTDDLFQIIGAATENKKATLDPSDESYGYKCAVCGEENFTRSASGQLICMTCHPPKRSKKMGQLDPNCSEYRKFVVVTLRRHGETTEAADMLGQFEREHYPSCEQCQKYNADWMSGKVGAQPWDKEAGDLLQMPKKEPEMTGRVGWNEYRCKNCGSIQPESTNHTGDIISFCKNCSWKPSWRGDGDYSGNAPNMAIPFGGHTYRPFEYVGPWKPAPWGKSTTSASEDEKGSVIGVVAAGENQYTKPSERVVLAEDWFIYVVDEKTDLMSVYNTEMWYEWGEIPNAFGEDTLSPQPGVDVMIPYAKGHDAEPLKDDAGKQMTLDEFTAANEWVDPFEPSDKWIEKESVLGHDFVDADQQAIRPDITPGDTGRLPHGRTQGSVKEGAVPAGALDIDQPAGVPTENWQCLNCGHEGMLSQRGKCEACGSDAVASMLPAPPEYSRYGIDPLKKSGRSLQVLECCGSVTGYHKMDCPVYTKNFDETIARLKALGKRGALKTAGKWMVTLRDAKGRTREQAVSAGENYGSAERAVRKYMKHGENIVFITVASKVAAAPAPAPAPAQAAPAPAPATPAVAPPSVVAPPAGTPLALQQQQKPEEPLRHTVPPEIPNRKYHMTGKQAALKTEQNTPEMEAQVAELAQVHPLTEIHENCNPAFEHEQWWVICGPCGAIWSVVDAEGGQSIGGLDLEEVDAGDESCQERFHEGSAEKTAFEPDANSGIRGSNDGTYIYQADIWCGNCAKEIAAELTAAGEAPEDPSDERSYDSDQFPKGPFFDEESDAPEHCSGCHIFLENPLTTHGEEYMKQMVDEAIEKGRGEEPHIKEWMDFYGYHGPEVEEEEDNGEGSTHEAATPAEAISALPQRGKPKSPEQLGLKRQPQQPKPQEVGYVPDSAVLSSDKTAEIDMGQVPSQQEIEDRKPREKKPTNWVSSMRVQKALPLIPKDQVLLFGWYGPDGEYGRRELRFWTLMAQNQYDRLVKSITRSMGSSSPEALYRAQNSLFNEIGKHAEHVEAGTKAESIEEQFKEKHEASATEQKPNPKKAPQKPKEPEQKDATMEKKAAQPTSGEDTGRYVKVTYTPRGIRLSPTEQLLQEVAQGGPQDEQTYADIWELMEDFFTNGWEQVRPEDIGALTDGELFSDPNGNVYWHERYQIEDMVEELKAGREVAMDFGGNLFDEETEAVKPEQVQSSQKTAGGLTVKTKQGEFTYDQADVVNPDDYIPKGEFNPYNKRPWLIHNEYGTLAIVYADHEQDALDEAVDADKMDSCLVPEEELKQNEHGEDVADHGDGEVVSRLGNAGEPFDLTYIGMVELPNQQYGVATAEQDSEIAEEAKAQEEHQSSVTPDGSQYVGDNAAVADKTAKPTREVKDKHGWTGRLRSNYDNDFEQFKGYDEVYNIAQRLGFQTAEEAWEANPKVYGSVYPEDLHVVGAVEKESSSDEAKYGHGFDNHPVVTMLWDYLKKDSQHKDRVQTAWGTKTKQGLVLSVARVMKESPVSGKEGSKKVAEHKHTCPECGKSLTCNNPKDCPGEGKKALCGACPQ